MNLSTPTLLHKALCVMLLATAQMATVHAAGATAGPGGTVELTDKNDGHLCSLAVPEAQLGQNKKIFKLNQAPGCKDDTAKAFKLVNVASATRMVFFSSPHCGTFPEPKEFYFHVETTRAGTNWQDALLFSQLAGTLEGNIVPGRNIQLVAKHIGEDLKGKELKDLLSCVEIERSPDIPTP